MTDNMADDRVYPVPGIAERVERHPHRRYNPGNSAATGENFGLYNRLAGGHADRPTIQEAGFLDTS
jgi:hypothetical protein